MADTKNALVTQGLKDMMERGYTGTGIQGVLSSVGVPKGSFYHYFASKDDFALAVLDRFTGWNVGMATRYLGDETRPPLARLHAYFMAYRDHYLATEFHEGCLLGSLGLELANQNPALTGQVEVVFHAWRDGLVQCLAAAKAADEIAADLDIPATAEFLLNSWEGAILRMRVSKGIAPIDTFIAMVFSKLLRHP